MQIFSDDPSHEIIDVTKEDLLHLVLKQQLQIHKLENRIEQLEVCITACCILP